MALGSTSRGACLAFVDASASSESDVESSALSEEESEEESALESLAFVSTFAPSWELCVSYVAEVDRFLGVGKPTSELSDELSESSDSSSTTTFGVFSFFAFFVALSLEVFGTSMVGSWAFSDLVLAILTVCHVLLRL